MNRSSKLLTFYFKAPVCPEEVARNPEADTGKDNSDEEFEKQFPSVKPLLKGFFRKDRFNFLTFFSITVTLIASFYTYHR